MERQNATPGDANLGGSGRDFYTRLTSRLPRIFTAANSRLYNPVLPQEGYSRPIIRRLKAGRCAGSVLASHRAQRIALIPSAFPSESCCSL